MGSWNGIGRVWRMFVYIGLRSRRTRLFAALALLAPAIQLLVAVASSLPGREFFTSTLLVYFMQLLVPLLAIFYGSSAINDELDDRTLVYLVTRPLPRPALLLGKFAAALTLTAAIAGTGFALSWLLACAPALAGAAGWGELGGYLGVTALALFAYSALFTLLGTFMRKAIILGLFFVFGWESAVQFLPGITQRLTLIHWVKSLLPAMPREAGFLMFQLEPSAPGAAVAVLLLTGCLALAAAMLVFSRRAYVQGDGG